MYQRPLFWYGTISDNGIGVGVRNVWSNGLESFDVWKFSNDIKFNGQCLIGGIWLI